MQPPIRQGMLCRIMELSSPSSPQEKELGYLVFDTAPSGVLKLGDTLYQVHGYRWESPMPEKDPSMAPVAVANIFVIRQSALARPVPGLPGGGGLVGLKTN